MSEKTFYDKIKEAGSHTIIYGIGSALQTMLGFVLIPLYTRYYTADMYGVLSLITLCGTLVGSVFYLGASSALSRSYYDYRDAEERKKVISTSFYITLAGALLQISLGFALRDRISMLLFHNGNYSLHISIILMSSAFTFINNLFYLLLRFERRSRQVITINIVSLVTSASLILFFLVKLKMGVLAPILGDFINQALMFLLLFGLARKSLVLDYSRREVNLQLKFGISQIFVGLSYYTLDWIDRLFINKYCSLSDVGVYSLGYKLGMAIHILFILPFSQIWAPMRMEYRHDPDAQELTKIILSYYFAAGLFVTITVSVFSRELITIIAGRPEYWMAYKVIPFIMFGHLLYGSINIIDFGIVSSRKVIYHIYAFGSVVMVNVLLNYVFLPGFGYMAAAYAKLFSFALLIAIVFVVSNRLYPIHFEGKRLAKVFLSGLSIVILGNIEVYNNQAAALFAKTLLVILLLVFWYLFVLDEKEKAKLSCLLGR